MFNTKKRLCLSVVICLVCIVVLFFSVSGICSYAAVDDEVQEVEAIPLRTGFMTMPTSAYGFMLSIDSSQSYSDFILDLLDVSTDSSSAIRYRFSGSDPTVYINSFAVENVTVDSFNITASDAFQNDASFASCSIINNSLLSVHFSPVDFVCVTDSIPTTSVLDYYILGITGLAYPIEMFIDYGSGSGSGICPTLQQQLEDYTGTFGNIVSMLNDRNYNEYADASAGIYDSGYDRGYSDAVGLRGSLQAGQIRLFDEVLDYSAFREDNPPSDQYTYSDQFNFHVYGGYHADYMIVQYAFNNGFETLQYSFTDEGSGGLTIVSRTSTGSQPDTTWLVPRGRLIVIDSMPDDPRFVQFIEDNSSIIDGEQAVKLYDFGYGNGFNDGWTDSAIGDTFKAPIDALNNMVLLETAGVTITLGGVILAMISLSIMIVFLKKFAGG